jgi:hypothetical protein
MPESEEMIKYEIYSIQDLNQIWMSGSTTTGSTKWLQPKTANWFINVIYLSGCMQCPDPPNLQDLNKIFPIQTIKYTNL